MTKDSDFAPSVGNMRAPKNTIRDDIGDLSAVKVKSDLDLHIVRLLSLHPQLKIYFRNHDLASIDDATKQALLNDMNKVLGIRPLENHRL
jgi:hypothetical protein